MVFGITTKKRFDKLHRALDFSFTKVKNDNKVLTDWIRFLHQKTVHQQRVIHRLHSQIQKSKIENLSHQEVRDILRAEYPVDEHRSHIIRFENRLGRVERLVSHMKDVHHQRAQAPSKVSTTRLQEKIVKTVSKQSKDYIKGTIRSLLEKFSSCSATQLREMVVEDQRLCSRSSFYRLLDELEKSGGVMVVSSGKERVFSINAKVFKQSTTSRN